VLSVSSPTKDEDPSLLRTADGRLLAAWFSDRGGNPDIYLAGSQDAIHWSDPVRVSSGPNGDFYPNLAQDPAGLIHLVWFQWNALFVGQIRHATSANGVVWSAEEPVTTDLQVDDWVPSIVIAANGDLLVYFVSLKRWQAGSTNRIYLARKRAGASSWDSPIRLSLGDESRHDHLPFAARIGNQIGLVWVRYPGGPDFITAPKSDLYFSTSPDGLTFAAPTQVTTESGNLKNLCPEIYQRHAGDWWLLWLSTRDGAPRLYEMPVSSLSRYPAEVTTNPALPAGYSHRVIATGTEREYLAAWVQGPEGAQDIYFRTFRR
jgi:hypothetical protein